MRIEEHLAKLYVEEKSDELVSIITKAFIDGYKRGLKNAHDVYIDGVRYYDLGLPSGTLWSFPITVKHQFSYTTYERLTYTDACDLEFPTIQDFEELKNHCIVLTDTCQEHNVVIKGPSGENILIGTKNYKNNPSNPNSVTCYRQGEGVQELTNMFWLKSDAIDNQALVGYVEYEGKSISLSTCFTGYKLPCILVKKLK